MIKSSHPQINSLLIIRKFTLATIDGLSTEQLNEVPAGYNNNIAWNVAHMIAAEQGVCYLRSGIPTVIPEHFYAAFKPGTKPSGFITPDQIESIKELLLSSLVSLEADLAENKFSNYTPWTTRYGAEMNNITEALNFLPFHEGMHLGYIMALKRLV
ncbi:MAG: DinB family protein [Bacteroidota bacterium]